MATSSEREFRAVWVATVANIDWPSSGQASSTQQQAELVALFDKLKELNFNAIVFQVCVVIVISIRVKVFIELRNLVVCYI